MVLSLIATRATTGLLVADAIGILLGALRSRPGTCSCCCKEDDIKQSDRTAPRSDFNTMLKEQISWMNSLNKNPQNITLSDHSTSSNVEISS